MTTAPTPTQLDALLEAADGGIDFDGLRVARNAQGIDVTVAGERHTQLTAAAARDVLGANPSFVTNWYIWHHGPHERGSGAFAFTRWLEHAAERAVPARYGRTHERVWGELSITARVREDGTRAYAVCHLADRTTESDALEVHRDPRAARELARFDDRERYRPLSTKPTLRTGWRFADLDRAAIVETVDAFYPATIANWHRERNGNLDVSHWADTAARQTGRYADVSELSSDAVERAAWACCTDTECLKRREWAFDADTPIDVPSGDGAFPCREPCSFLIAAAHEWVELERDTEETYVTDLTPSERAQLRDIVTTAARDELADIGEGAFDAPANRHRIRYLAAKHFEEGDPFRDA